MTKYLVKKLGGWLAIIFIATNITFFLATAFLDPKSNYVGRRPPLPEDQIQRTLQPLNLSDNTPLFERWWTWLSNILFHWDWGESPLGESVNQQISFRIWVSAELLLLATVLSVIIGVAIGVYTASNQYKMGDRIWQGISIVTMNLHIVVASIITVAFGLWVNRITGSRIFYVTGASKYGVHGFFPTLLDFLQHVALPTFSLLLVNYAGYHMMQRSLLLDNLNADYVRTARAKGLPRRKAIRKHALRTSIIPVATSVAFSIPGIFTGAIMTEKIFAWQGMGDYFITALSHNDIYGTVAVAAFGAFTTAVAAILADITVVILDPRVRVS
ncbi:ABC transporter permease [Corynebacterium sp. MC-04]|uniref:ABC transporter permease n=1 Tax=Corynebacterium parakroppenstedtii TaxID=2828363 RepID=A0ABS9HJF0_9CORY|nr:MULTISPECIES: ABC transporter permease [Corynebacterium]MDU3197582.1 ABC transporter permease [Corynebacterium kroppenstedtii]MBY0787860.1 ABC transporter permease [Corynebacterium parakroppenstedtii]MBY0791936.1 ABC transporter permease [Corynebacterium parakroppenstedtii]MBY0796306.1 ABC transporter permease [Corynebacterium parakroppenstedtii]MCF6768886.1 ABC transporter permease [Corynebacterium parakroppenstedtii]